MTADAKSFLGAGGMAPRRETAVYRQQTDVETVPRGVTAR